MVAEQRLEIADTRLEVVDVTTRDLAFADGVKTNAFDFGFDAIGAARQLLVAAVLSRRSPKSVLILELDIHIRSHPQLS